MGYLHSTGALVGRTVVLGDVPLAVAVDALLDRPLRRLVGFDIRCGDGAHRFLPFPACELLEDRIGVESALVLLDQGLDFYRLGGSAYSDLRGLPVQLGGAVSGSLVDLAVSTEGDVRRIVASTSQGNQVLEPGPGLVVGNHLLRPAV